MSLEQRIQEHYSAQSLSAEALERLLDVGVDDRSRPSRTLARPTLLAAAIVISIGLVALLGSVLGSRQKTTETAQRIQREVATNHLKLRQPDYQGGSLVTLREQMNELDFYLIDVELPIDESVQLVGARYCSIDGQLAAQLHFEDATGRRWTLYQTRLTDPLRRVQLDGSPLDGVGVRLWHEKGVFLALASGAS